MSLSLSVPPAFPEFLSLLLPAGGSLSPALNFGEFQAAAAAAATRGAGNVSAGSGGFSRALFIARLKVPARRPGRRVSRRGATHSRSRVRGAGAPAAGRSRPRLPALESQQDPGFPRAAARVLSPCAGSDAGRGHGPAPARPPAWKRLRGCGRERAGRTAGGARRGEGAAAQPIGAAAGIPLTVPPTPRGLAATSCLPGEGRGGVVCTPEAHPFPPALCVRVSSPERGGRVGRGFRGHGQPGKERSLP